MKKLLLSALFLSVFALSSAQIKSSFGVKAGVNFSTLYAEDVDDKNMLVNINVGIVAVIPLTDFLGFQPEILYSGKGAELKYSNILVEGKAKFNLAYIEVPLLLRMNLSENFSVQAGPYIAYLINANIQNETNNELFDSETELDTSDFTKFDYGLAGGLEFDFSPIAVGARYSYGMANIGKERTVGGNSFTFPDAKNSTFSIYAVLRF